MPKDKVRLRTLGSETAGTEQSSSIEAGGYILRVPPNRRKILLEHEETGGWFGPSFLAEPVPKFAHSRRAPLIVFACFDDNAITHLASGSKGKSAGTDLDKLNFFDLAPLSAPITFDKLLASAPANIKRHLERMLDSGGLLPSKTFESVVDILLRIDPSLAGRLARFSGERRQRIRQLSARARSNLALQKETLVAALEITGISTDEILDWSPRVDKTDRLFLDGLPQTHSREDSMIISDWGSTPGFDPFKGYQHSSRTFQSKSDPDLKLTVTMANKLALEEQTGADLIYFNETYHSFVLVQYKAMEREGKQYRFRWKPGDQLADEIDRMDALLKELAKVQPDLTPHSYRLNENPFFLKICKRTNFNPDDKGLFPGMYLPLDYWKRLASDETTRGPKDGRYISYENVARRLSNSEFISVVSGAWIGTTVPQSAILGTVIRKVLETGKTVTFAVRLKPSSKVSLTEGDQISDDQEPPLGFETAE